MHTFSLVSERLIFCNDTFVYNFSFILLKKHFIWDVLGKMIPWKTLRGMYHYKINDYEILMLKNFYPGLWCPLILMFWFFYYVDEGRKFDGWLFVLSD